MNAEQLRIKELKAKLELAKDDLSIRTAELERVESERDALQARVNRLEEALDALTSVVGLTPVLGNKEALQEAFDAALVALRDKETK